MTVGGDGFWDPLTTSSGEDTLNTVSVSAGDSYEAWPKVLHDPLTGDLVAFWADGTAHSGTTSHEVKARRSADLGLTWTDESTVDSDASYSVIAHGAGYDSDGNMLLWSRRRTAVDADPMVNHQLLRSTDGGLTFSAISTFVGSPIPRVVWDIIEVPTVGLMCWWSDSSAYGILTSGDDGITWTQTTIASGLTSSQVPGEATLVYLGDGKILALGRTEDVAGSGVWQLQSTDSGTTWAAPSESNIVDAFRTSVTVAYNGDGRWLDVYYYDRTDLMLRWLRADVDDIWDAPTSWPASTDLYQGAADDFVHAGYAHAVRLGTRTVVAFYEGTATETTVKALIHELATDREALTLGGLANVDLTGDAITDATQVLVRDPDLPPDALNAWRLGTVAASPAASDETVFAPSYTVTDGTNLDVAVTFVWGIDGTGDPYYNAAGVTAGDEAVLVLDNTTGDLSLRPVEV